MIIGEIKRFLRDDGILKVSRSIKENQYRIYKMREELEKKLGREPELRELSVAMDMPVEEIAITMESSAEVESIYRTVYHGDGTDLQLVDRLPEKEDHQEKLLNRIFLEEILEKLEEEERQLIGLRYFQDMTQTEVAKRMGVSQVQVSRMEKRILKKLREMEK
ncbi:sigma-70 family RNA polymerase sigma factor [Blautia sp. Sow4_E7]|uniref:sigma-70 family RNA polymerase sigma factor n=1 Tax=Blautia sp. Sow4_E7 TaxID=3438749 RepID=UPI003F8EA0BB